MPVSSELQSTILQKQRDGATITQIAQELGLSRTTVYKSLSAVDNWDSWVKDKSNNIKRLAYNAVEKGLSRQDARAASLGLDWLKLTDLAPQQGDRYLVAGDMHVSQAVNLLPSTPSPASTASTAMTTSATSSPNGTSTTEAPEKVASCSTDVPCHKNFADFSLAELEAEVARRKSQVMDAEVIG